MAHKKLSIQDRQELLDELADVLREIHGAMNSMPVRAERKGATRQELGKRFPALDGRTNGVPGQGGRLAPRPVAGDAEDEIRRALGR